MTLLLSVAISANAEISDVQSDEGRSSPLVDRIHQGFETRLDKYAQYFDNFFADERSDEEAGHSQIRLIGSFLHTESGGLKFTPQVRARLTLPHLKNRVNLLIDTESDDITGLADQGSDTLTTSEPRNETNIAIQLVQKRTTEIGISHRIGLTLKGDLLNPKARSQIRFTWQTSKRDLVRFTQAVFLERLDGFGQESRLDFERLLHRKTPNSSSLLRVTLRGLTSEASDGYEWSLPIEVLNALPNQRAYAYGGSISGVTDSDCGITNSAVFFRYRQSLWRDWFYIDLTPQLEWPKAEGRNTTAKIKLSFEILL